MEQVDKRVAESLTRFYVVALLVVAFLTLGGLYLIRKTILSLNYDSRIVNVAGRQRMLSQRLTKLAVLKMENIAHSDSADFDSLLHVWKTSHEQLASRKLPVEKNVTVWKSSVLDEMFVNLQPVFDEIYSGFKIIGKKDAASEAKQNALKLILKNEPVFLAGMDRIVFQFDKESFARLQNLEKIEWILDIMTIIVLLAEGLLIFRPVVNTTRRAIRMVRNSELALLKSNSELEKSNAELIKAQKEIIRIEEEKYELQLAEERIRSASLIEGQEEERKRFARELHDGIGQMLTGLKLHAEKLGQNRFADEKQQQRFEQLVKLIQETIQTTRRISYNLMPSVLEDFGLKAALNLLCEQTRESSGIKVTFDGNEEKAELSQAMTIGLYRIAQEAVNNAVKHASPDHILVTLKQEKYHVTLEIQDDGKGFLIDDLKTRPASFLDHNGIENIRTRTELMNGELRIESRPNGGTRLEINIDI
ncbi:sensor histidine kinase [Dyadobacter sediminis]|uniref:histidine kinase n=1 Tax=Dyadobacter sediminis TaxID=1493691 RepID=A0A5R9KCK0_9BACT|nr:ATP-binding protein [Dyadobacter sediminis]TLU92514.1 histidine kinase [Dyadobacter sediminis]GGB94481.1 hypothetical protein GCM10011325_22300 [Dyadobacter sediminis]